jgi:toxin FitB
MYILDTNVLSAIRRPERTSQHFRDWAERHDDENSYLSAVSIFEIELGTAQLARRDSVQANVLRRWIDTQVLVPFADRILPINAEIARCCAGLHVPDPRPERDAFIAATALVHGFTVVTRNVRDFELMGVSTLDPWQPVAGSGALNTGSRRRPFPHRPI